MNMLLIFFAIPFAVIVFSIALQKILKTPVLVAAIIFAIGINLAFIMGNLNIIAATLVYTFISYITALITKVKDMENNERTSCSCGRYMRR